MNTRIQIQQKQTEATEASTASGHRAAAVQPRRSATGPRSQQVGNHEIIGKSRQLTASGRAAGGDRPRSENLTAQPEDGLRGISRWPRFLCAFCASLWLTLSCSWPATAATRYVWQDSPSPAPPYTSWATAATNIQDAVDAADPGDTVLVTNGVYATGGKADEFGDTNRVLVNKPLTLESVNGPHSTVILGSKVPQIRCVYLTNGASLLGFTLTNGAASVAGGLLCESPMNLVSNCVLTGNSGKGSGFSGVGGAVFRGTLDNCILSGNSATDRGGGAYYSTLTNCLIVGNTANEGGGAFGSALNRCILTNNEAHASGGGVQFSTLNNCLLTGNWAWGGGGGGAAGSLLNHCTLRNNGGSPFGGGAGDSTLNNCDLTGNAAADGGGTAGGILNNCILTGNEADRGGGVFGGTLDSCTLSGNMAYSVGGGAYAASLSNCIVYFNSAPDSENYYQDQFDGGDLNYSCTFPLPTNGVGNIDLDPLFVDTNGWSNLRLQSNSPCINAGNNADVIGSTDLDGRPRIVGGTVDMGAYEFQGPGFSEFIGWLAQYDLPTDGSADFTDADTDGHNNWQEWKAWTIPTDPASVLKLLTPQPDANGTLISWQSVLGQSYLLERATNATGAFSLLQANIPGQAGTTSFTDPNAAAGSPVLYRVGVP